MAKKKQSSSPVGWVILGLMACGIYHFGVLGNHGGGAASGPRSPSSVSATPSASSASVPLDRPRFVNVASLNVRHTPSLSGPLITALPRGTALKVLDRDGGWLLVDLGPRLEGWVAERLTTTQGPKPSYLPPAGLSGSK